MESFFVTIIGPLVLSVLTFCYHKHITRFLKNKTAYKITQQTKRTIQIKGECRLNLLDDNNKHTITASGWLREDGYQIQFIDNSPNNPSVPYLIIKA
jgi:FlaG/FlaF family flagellin (archaellin)